MAGFVAKGQALDGPVKGVSAAGTQVGFGRLRVNQVVLRLLYAGQYGRIAQGIAIHADAKVNFFFPGIGLIFGNYLQDRVLGHRRQFFKQW